jgi:hypothetical protein
MIINNRRVSNSTHHTHIPCCRSSNNSLSSQKQQFSHWRNSVTFITGNAQLKSKNKKQTQKNDPKNWKIPTPKICQILSTRFIQPSWHHQDDEQTQKRKKKWHKFLFKKFFFCSTLSEFGNFLLCERILINVTTCQNETSS